jgi:hypothetical protein
MVTGSTLRSCRVAQKAAIKKILRSGVNVDYMSIRHVCNTDG